VLRRYLFPALRSKVRIRKRKTFGFLKLPQLHTPAHYYCLLLGERKLRPVAATMLVLMLAGRSLHDWLGFLINWEANPACYVVMPFCTTYMLLELRCHEVSSISMLSHIAQGEFALSIKHNINDPRQPANTAQTSPCLASCDIRFDRMHALKCVQIPASAP
jgi:hypothetical protein